MTDFISSLPEDTTVVTVPMDAESLPAFIIIHLKPKRQPLAPRHGAEGIDVSRHQGAIDWQKVKLSHKEFAFIRATMGLPADGLTGVDDKFSANWLGARAAGLLRGAYHYFVWNLDGKAQAQHFLRTLGNDVGELPLVIDVEPRARDYLNTTPGYKEVDRDVSLSNLMACIGEIERATGQPPMLYTSNWALGWMVRDTDRRLLTKCPLWIAAYMTSPPKPTIPWTGYSCWQYSSAGAVGGIAGGVDLDIWQ